MKQQDTTMIKRLKMLAALLLVITASQAANHRLTLQEWRADDGGKGLPSD
jgi:hypothetical protein